MERAPYHQHLHILLDKTLNFKQHIESDILKIDKGISDKKKKNSNKVSTEILCDNLQSLIDYGDIIFDQS